MEILSLLRHQYFTYVYNDVICLSMQLPYCIYWKLWMIFLKIMLVWILNVEQSKNCLLILKIHFELIFTFCLHVMFRNSCCKFQFQEILVIIIQFGVKAIKQPWLLYLILKGFLVWHSEVQKRSKLYVTWMFN